MKAFVSNEHLSLQTRKLSVLLKPMSFRKLHLYL